MQPHHTDGTPPSTPKRQEYDTPRRVRFYALYDTRQSDEEVKTIATRIGISKATGNRWLRQRQNLGSPAMRRTRKLSTRLGRHQKVPPERIKMLVDPEQNPVRDQRLEAQLAHHHINLGVRQLQRRFAQDTNGAQMYKMAYTKKKLSSVNKRKRIAYAKEHENKTIGNFWRYVLFTDEAHVDPSSECQGRTLRERGTRYDIENIQERLPKTGSKFHIAGWVTWDHKCERLEFYNDEYS